MRNDRSARARGALVLGLAVALLLGACGGSGGSSGSSGGDGDAKGNGSAVDQVPEDEGTPVDGGGLVFAVEAETDGWNPAFNRFALSGNLVASAIYEPLVAITEDGSLEPWLAESVTPNDDASVWTITVREGVTFHDGTPLDAEAVRANIEARRESPLASVAVEPIESVDVVDDRTVTVTMDGPWVGFDYTLAAQGGYVFAPSMLDAEQAGAESPVGTGAFAFDEWVQDSHVKVERYDGYWQEGLPHLDTIEFRVITDPDARGLALESGDVDAIVTADTGDIVRFRDTDLTQIEDGQGEETFVMLNTAAPPFDSLTARRALAYATDRDLLIDTLQDGVPAKADGPYAEGEQWYVEDLGHVEYDPDKARELVAQYEEETGESLTFTLGGTTTAGQSSLQEALTLQWSEVGIEAELETLEQTAYISKAVTSDFQAILFRNFAYVDPDSNWIFWHSETAKGPGQISINFPQYKNPEIDSALETGRSTADPATRYEAYAGVQRLLNEDLPYLWLFHTQWAIVSKPEIKGWATAEERGFSRQDAKVFWARLWRGE